MAAIIANVVANKRSRTTSLLPFFVDGSASHDENNAAALPLAAAGYSVVYPQALSGQWVTSAWSCLAYDNNQPEILAVLEALNIAKVLRQGKSMWSHTEPLEVHIFTDSHAAVTYIQKGLNLEVTDLFAALVQPAISAIIRLSHELSAIGVAVWLRNIPGHKHQVVPHQLADTTSRKVAFSGINRCEVDAGGPPYVPIGSSIQRQALQIAKRHPWLDDEGTSGSSKSANATFRTQVTNGHIITCPPVTKDQGSGQNMPKRTKPRPDTVR
ncbi:hypothetical protein B0T17DRAFT_409668 [Bombardia bombarda]|uniref:RNase H type-1 domain-containing protein n=1 Tax=Bombardia bombarda TaxID=252184 RepID=A0AA39T2B8_9PEZI|nr:hypothetical protein B0T17DRAFT_409668 [Bombardia bombarda]